MQTTIRSGVGWDLVVLNGPITSADIGQLEDHLQRFLTMGHYNVILDLTNVTYIGSAGLSLLIRYTIAFRRWEQGDLHLANLPETLRSLLQVAGLVSENHSHFSIYPNVDAAQKAAEKRISK